MKRLYRITVVSPLDGKTYIKSVTADSRRQLESREWYKRANHLGYHIDIVQIDSTRPKVIPLRDTPLLKSCIFCWASNIGHSDLRLFTYNQRTYYVHPECLLLWEKSKELIHRGILLHGYSYSNSPKLKLLQDFVNRFFLTNLKRIDPKALTREVDFLKYVD